MSNYQMDTLCMVLVLLIVGADWLLAIWRTDGPHEEQDEPRVACLLNELPADPGKSDGEE